MKNQINTITEFCEKQHIKSRLKELLGEGAKQFASNVIQITKENTLLSKSKPESIIMSALIAASLDLSINKSLGQAYIVPFKGDAQCQIGYKGFIQLALRSGQFSKLIDFKVPYGSLIHWEPTTEDLKIDPKIEDSDRDADGYAVHFELTNGFKKTVFWSLGKVIRHAEKYSQSYRSGASSPWKSNFDEMALKTVIKSALSKYAPMTPQLEKAIAQDQSSATLDGEIKYPDNPRKIEEIEIKIDPIDPIDPFSEPESN